MNRLSLFLYYLIFQHLPMQPFPGYRLGYWLRGKVVSRLFKRCGRNPIVKNKCYFGDGSKISLGNNAQLGQNARLQGEIAIGDDCVMGPDVIIMATYHKIADPDVPIRLQGGGENPVVIGDDVWLGTRAIILPGVTLGNHCIVGAGAVVTKSFPDYSIVGGVPARILRMRKP